MPLVIVNYGRGALDPTAFFICALDALYPKAVGKGSPTALFLAPGLWMGILEVRGW
jgi:hypothetical protein